jgi:hypothetical protein
LNARVDWRGAQNGGATVIHGWRPEGGLTIAPWAVVASLPFAPEIVLPTIAHFDRLRLLGVHPYGCKATFNPTFPDGRGSPESWVSPWHFGINEGPIVVMIENSESGPVWRLTRAP